METNGNLKGVSLLMSYIADGKSSGPAITWPNGARIAVMVTFDYDAEFLRISRAKTKGTKIGFTDFSRGQYGPHEGLRRCLDMLDTMNIKSTFFVPGIVAETYRDTVEEIHRRGHEIATDICTSPIRISPVRRCARFLTEVRQFLLRSPEENRSVTADRRA